MSNRHFKRNRKFEKAIKKKACKKLSNKLRRKKTLIERAKQYVKIFTEESVTDNEILLLSKGLKYVPSPPLKRTKSDLIKDYNEFARKLRCKFHFDEGNDYKYHPFLTSSGYKPCPANNSLENYIFQTRLEIDNLKIVHSKDNLNKDERAALHSIKSNRNFVLRRADKNNCTVIWDKNEYIKEAYRQLSSQVHYEEIDTFSSANLISGY